MQIHKTSSKLKNKMTTQFTLATMNFKIQHADKEKKNKKNKKIPIYI